MADTGGPGVKAAARVALFDLDNTLIDRDAAFVNWSARFLAGRGLDAGELAWMVETDDEGNRSRVDFFSSVRARFGLDDDALALSHAYTEALASMYAPEPAVINALTSLRVAGWKIVVVTNGPPSQEVKIRAAALHDVVDGWCISANVGAVKPQRAIFEAAAACGGASLDATLVGWMVGDNAEADILGGMRAGLRTVWMTRGRTWTRSDYSPDAVATDVAEAVEVILDG